MQSGESDSREVARAAIMLAMSSTRQEEAGLKASLAAEDICAAAADYGGEFVQSVMKIVERAVVCAKREGLIGDAHHEEGAVAGAAREALSQVSAKALGLSSIKMNSGAGHDAQVIGLKVPTGMIFVPSRKGISHSPDEFTCGDDLEKGAYVLRETIYRLAY